MNPKKLEIDLNEALQTFGIEKELIDLMKLPIPFEEYKVKFEELMGRVKVKYKELVKKYHPDLVGGDDTMIKRVNAAFDLLGKVKPIPARPARPAPPPVIIQQVIFSNSPATTSSATTSDYSTYSGLGPGIPWWM